jgi:HK97 family phage major capsid protein
MAPPKGVDIYRGTTGVELPPEVSREIWVNAQHSSIIMQLCRRIEVPGAGLVIPIITGDPTAEWVSETEEKPVKRHEFGSKPLKPYTAAVIEPFSKQFTRDLAALYNECKTRLPNALAKHFDQSVFGYVDGPGTGFDQLDEAPEISIAGDGPDVYDAFVAALSSVVEAEDGADVTGWALSGQAEVITLGAKDNNGRPLFISSVTTEGSVGNVLARPAFKNSHVVDSDTGTVGWAGDWSSAVWGVVEPISISISDQATLTDGTKQLNLWQRNMVAIKAEFEVGFVARNVDRFCRLTGNGHGAATTT